MPVSRPRLVARLFRIEPGEGLRAGLMLVYNVAVVGGVVITGQLISRSLFLSALPRAAVPFKFILPPLALMLTTALYVRVAGRVRRDHLIAGSCAVMFLGVAAFYVLLHSAYRQNFGTLCALFVFFDVVASLAIIQFWTFAGDIFNPREARRLFGLITGGSTVSNVVFGLALSTAATTVLPRDLIVVMLVSLGVSIGCVLFLGARYRQDLEATRRDSGSTPGRVLARPSARGGLLKSPLLISLGGLAVVAALVSNIADYQLDLALQSAYGGDSQGMVAFLGQFRFWGGLGAGLLQYFLAVRIMERFGLAAVLLLLPVSMALGSGSVLLTGGVLWAAAIPRACDIVLKYTVNDAALNLLYLPVMSELRVRARAIIDGMVKPPAVSLLGLAFLVLGAYEGITIVHWVGPVLLLIAVWLFLVRRAARQYVLALAESLQLRRLDLDQERLDLSDESSIGVVRTTLQSSDPMQVVHALSLLPRMSKVDWTVNVSALLQHPSEHVRAAALGYVGEAGIVGAGVDVAALLDDPAETVRAAAIESSCVLRGADAMTDVARGLDDDSPRVRSAAVLCLIRHGGTDGAESASKYLHDLFAHPQRQVRIEGASMLGKLDASIAVPHLVSLLNDASVNVRTAAVRASGRIASPDLVPQLIARLAHPATRRPASEALIQCLGDDLTAVKTVLDNEAQPHRLRCQLVRVMGTVESERASHILERHFHSDDTRFRGAAYEALLQRHERIGPCSWLTTAQLQEALEREVRVALDLRRLRAGLGAHADDGSLLLDDALTLLDRQAVDRLIALLDMLYAEISYDSVRESLSSDDRRRRASTVELIDNVVDRHQRELLLPLFARRAEAGEEMPSVEPTTPTDELVCELARGGDEWLRACALFRIGRGRLTACTEVVDACLTDTDSRVRETAQFALRALLPPAELQRRLDSHMTAGDYARSNPYAAQMCRTLERGESAMALSQLEKVFFLKSVPLFEHIPGEEIVEIVPILQEVELEAGETFIKRGQEGNCLYILVEGEVVVRLEGRVERVMTSRDVIGELAVIFEQPRSADCTATTRVVALRIDKADFWQLLNEQPQLTIEVMKVLVDRYVTGFGEQR